MRVLVITFVGTLLVFAVSLLLAIVGTVIASALRGIHADMSIAYRFIAFPMAAFAGVILFIASLVLEVRRYLKDRVLRRD